MPNPVTSSVIDWELGTQLVGGKREIAEEMIALLIECLSEHQKELSEAFKSNDYQRLALATHRLHGAACYCGTPRLKQAAQQLESATKTKEKEKIQVAYQNLCDEIEAILAISD